jgi:hypothetical protein
MGKEVNIDYIELGGKKYPYRTVYHKNAERDVMIGCDSLDVELFDEEGRYKSDYHQKVDEHFYAFVEDTHILNMNDKELEEYVNKYID